MSGKVLPFPQRTQAAEVEQHIARARELLRPTPVRLHHMPPWFKKAIREAVKAKRLRLGIWAGGTDFLIDEPWMDHWGSTKLPNGAVAFVSEPYLRTEHLPRILEIATALSDVCAFAIEPNSWWYPGWTTRLEFAPKVGGGE